MALEVGCSVMRRVIWAVAIAAGLAWAWSDQHSWCAVQSDDPAGFDSLWLEIESALGAIETRHPRPLTRREALLRGFEAAFPERADLSTLARRLDETAWGSLRAESREIWSESLAAYGGEASVAAEQFMAGMVRALEGDVVWVSRAEAAVAAQLRANRYVGIGIRLVVDERGVVLEEAFWGGAAHEAGLRKGDRLIAIDGESTVGEAIGPVVEALRGGAGTNVRLMVEREGLPAWEVVLTHAEVPIASVEGPVRKGREEWQVAWDEGESMGCLRMLRMTGSSVAEMRHLLRQARGQGIETLVLDLRGCRESDSHQAVLMADLFCGEGVLGVRQSGDRQELIRASGDAQCADRRLMLLVGPDTAGDVVWMARAISRLRAAELFAGEGLRPAFERESVELSTGSVLEGLPVGRLGFEGETGPSAQGLDRGTVPLSVAGAMGSREFPGKEDLGIREVLSWREASGRR